jgi:hypothetical protein
MDYCLTYHIVLGLRKHQELANQKCKNVGSHPGLTDHVFFFLVWTFGITKVENG